MNIALYYVRGGWRSFKALMCTLDLVVFRPCVDELSNICKIGLDMCRPLYNFGSCGFVMCIIVSVVYLSHLKGRGDEQLMIKHNTKKKEGEK